MHITKYYFLLQRLSKRLIIRAYLSVAFAILLALVAVKLGGLVPAAWAQFLGNQAVDEILKILASSMLMVATFSLSTMVAAYSAASQGVTPRAARLLMEDRESLNALSIFLGAFIFSVVAIIALSTGFYEKAERFVLFVFTVLLVVVIVWTIVGWIEKLARLGRVHETIHAVEDICEKSLDKLGVDLFYGANDIRNQEALFDKGIELFHEKIGYIRSIDYEALNQLATQYGVKIFVEVEAGAYLYASRRIGLVKSEMRDETQLQSLRDCFDIGTSRFFESDPRFGFITLGEVASRALSPAVNDPGTAIDVIGSMIRLMTWWDQHIKVTRPQVKYQNLYLNPFESCAFFQDIVNPISRDGAKHLEVNIRLYKALEALERLHDRDLQSCAKEWKERIYKRAMTSLEFEDDRILLTTLKSS